MDTIGVNKLLSGIERKSPEECWPWRGTPSHGGYGTVRSEFKATMYAHRAAYEYFNGVTLVRSQHVCHKCDNPNCVNPAHLFIGSHKDNMNDRDSKLRQPHGEKNGQSILTEPQVLEIRAIGRSKPQTEIARMFGISRAAVGDILKGRRWVHVGGPLVSRESEHANKRAGVMHNMAKRTIDEVKSIREMAKSLPYREIARRTGIDRKSVSTIARGLRWSSVGG